MTDYSDRPAAIGPGYGDTQPMRQAVERVSALAAANPDNPGPGSGHDAGTGGVAPGSARPAVQAPTGRRSLFRR